VARAGEASDERVDAFGRADFESLTGVSASDEEIALYTRGLDFACNPLRCAMRSRRPAQDL
jgi:hypothetical protein